MSKRQKLIFRVSIGLNILLISLVAWGYLRMNFVKDQVFLTEVQVNLVELEGLIAKQSSENWTEPNLVTTELGGVLNGIWLGITTGDQLGTLSKGDKRTLQELYNKLSQYPHDKLYRFSELTEQDKKNFEELRVKLRDVGLGIKIQVHANMKYFMSQAKELERKGN